VKSAAVTPLKSTEFAPVPPLTTFEATVFATSVPLSGPGPLTRAFSLEAVMVMLPASVLMTSSVFVAALMNSGNAKPFFGRRSAASTRDLIKISVGRAHLHCGILKLSRSRTQADRAAP
jgi:hypothetical protein